MDDRGPVSREDILHGVHFHVRYVGSIPIQASMKTLEFDLRTAIAKECIARVCEAAKLICGRKKIKAKIPVDPGTFLGDGQPELRWTGMDVTLIVSRESLTIVPLDRPANNALFLHSMPNISFASGGDEAGRLEETGEFVCYVGKSEDEGRRCYVFECGVINAPGLLDAIGQAFKLRFEEAQLVAEPKIAASNARQHSLSASLPTGVPTPSAESPVAEESAEAVALRRKPWYHGALSRAEAESLLRRDGDFLVRESAQGPGQFVLTGLQGGTPKHLLLIDGDGKVRTKTRTFTSVSHLISYHRENNLPITSSESALILKAPILHNSPA